LDTPLVLSTLLAATFSGFVCAASGWAAPARRFDADGSPKGFPGAGLALTTGIVLALALLGVGDLGPVAKGLAVAMSVLFLVGAATEWIPVAIARPARLIALVWAAVYLVAAGLRVTEIKLPFGPVVQLGFMGPVLTCAWVFVVSLLVTLSNRGEALVPGIAVFSSLTLAAVAAMAGQHAVSVAAATHLGLTIAGASAPVLAWCQPPSKVRFGIGGGMAAGIALASLSVLAAVKHASFLFLVVPALCLGAPLFASLIAIALNRSRGLGSVLLEAERVTFVGALVRRGMTARQAVHFLLVWHIYLCSVALLLTWAIERSWVLKAVVLLILGGVGALGFAITFQVVYGWRAQASRGLGPSSIDLLGVRIDRTTMRDAVGRALLWAGSDQLHHIVTADATLVERCNSDPELSAIVDKASLVTPDGAGTLFAARLLGAPFPERVAGADLTVALCEAAADHGAPVYFLGAAPEVARHAAGRLEARFRELTVAGARHGYFEPSEEPAVCAEIAASGARVLFVGLGVPAQERFIDRHRHDLGVGVAIGVGGTFDVLAGKVKRAPRWMQRCGLEWLWRVAQDPRRLPRLIALPRFCFHVLVHTARTRRLGRLTETEG
jgi:N-acetylglucosaminyldiphosphoundecaprenol N-acetyl-beta-D-mannosaminyltransferase